MKTKRQLKQRSSGYVDEKYYEAKRQLEENAKKGCCLICGKELVKPHGNQKYCSSECFHNWFDQFDPPYKWNNIRDKVLLRDKYTCKNCGKTQDELRKLHIIDEEDGKIDWASRHMNWNLQRMIVDHIISIALGRDEWDMNNLQTLCWTCNKIKTKEDCEKITRYRNNLPPSNQRKLAFNLI